jgi:hypothetical protein
MSSTEIVFFRLSTFDFYYKKLHYVLYLLYFEMAHSVHDDKNFVQYTVHFLNVV